MSRKKTQLDEFCAMGQVAEILKPFCEETRERIIFTVAMKLKAEQPKKRIRSKLGNSPLMNGLPVIEIGRDH